MTTIESEPWWETVLERLRLARAERLLMLQAGPAAVIAGILQAIGSSGRLMVVEPRRALALTLAELGQIEVVSVHPAGGERFGSFDAFVSAPLTMPAWPFAATLSLAVGNLRPGGRFVIDMPGDPMSEDLVNAYTKAGGDMQDIAPFTGPSRKDLEVTLGQRAIRSPEVSEHHHMVRFESPLLLARMACDLAPSAEPLHDDLTLRLIERMRTTGGADYVMRRISAIGMR